MVICVFAMSGDEPLSGEIRLSSSGMKRVCQQEGKGFLFVVGDKSYQCCVAQACFISPLVSRLVSMDCTVDCLQLEVDDADGLFCDILGLGEGGSMRIDQQNYKVVRALAIGLENVELASLVDGFDIDGPYHDIDAAIENLCMKNGLGVAADEETSFIASHFYELDVGRLFSLGISGLEQVLGDKHLKLEDENALVDTLASLCSRDDAYCCMFRYVHFEYVDASHLDLYLDHVYGDHLDGVVWERICNNLRNGLNPGSSHRDSPGLRFRWISFEYVNEHPFDGIISHLANECGGNAHENGVVNITSSSNFRNMAYRVTDYGWDDYWASQDVPDSWICFDFKEKRVHLKKYSLKPVSELYPVSWVMEGSTNGTDWKEIDRRNTMDMKGEGTVKVYECENNSRSEGFRFLRFRQIGKNSSGSNVLSMASIEFFGKLETDEEAAELRARLLSSEAERRLRGEFSLCDDRPFWGIFSQLAEECGGNVHRKGVVYISASGTTERQCHQVTDYWWGGAWRSTDIRGSWICFDFKERKVRLGQYSLKSDGYKRNGNLIDWIIEGSNDGWEWKEGDRRHTMDLSGCWVVQTYECKGEGCSESFRYLRLRQTDRNSNGDDRICLSEIEFFGTLSH